MDRAHELFLDRNYKFQRHVYDATREFYLLGRNRLIDGLGPPEGGTILEIGCGTARNLRRAAAAYPSARLYGVDLSRAMLATANRRIAGTPLRSRVTLAHGDAATFDPAQLFGRTTFDRVFFSYALSMIPAWQIALRHAWTLIGPDSSLHVVDFGCGAGLPLVANRALRAWLAGFHVEPRDSLVAELRSIARATEALLTSQALHGGYAEHAVLSRSSVSR
jgi:S-adenosylmethionine-diacylgycerolhomoserine-N-methlytransferase